MGTRGAGELGEGHYDNKVLHTTLQKIFCVRACNLVFYIPLHASTPLWAYSEHYPKLLIQYSISGALPLQVN